MIRRDTLPFCWKLRVTKTKEAVIMHPEVYKTFDKKSVVVLFPIRLVRPNSLKEQSAIRKSWKKYYFFNSSCLHDLLCILRVSILILPLSSSLLIVFSGPHHPDTGFI